MINFFSKIYHCFFPNACLFCGEYLPPKIYACKECLPDDFIERIFNIRVSRQRFFLKVYSLDLYENEIQKNIRHLKFHGFYSYSKKFMSVIYPLFHKYNLDSYDAICYVPMTKKHEYERGYNQAKLLAQNLSTLSNIPVKDYIKKVKSNKTQHSLNAKLRWKNIQNVYAVTEDLRGKKILLIDDILTTGATLCECAKTLYKMGAGSVTGITVACVKYEPS
ncbi:MAG: ComF family protein [Clostridia bacterium]